MTQHKDQTVNRLLTVGILAGAVKAGQNHYQQTGDASTSFQIGLNAILKLFLWIMLCFFWWCALCWVAVWWFAILSGSYPLSPKLVVLLLAGPALFALSPLLGVLWCRNGDYCLFQRGPVYRFWQGTARRLEDWSEAKVCMVLLGGIWTSNILLAILP